MNILLFSVNDKISQHKIRISDYRFEHLRNRKKNPSGPDLTPGNQLKLGEINGLMGQGTITEFTESHIEIRLEALWDSPPEPLDVILIVALPRPKMLKRIFREATTLGIKEFYIINSYKVDKSYWKSPLLTQEKLKHYLLTGLEQGIDTILPTIHLKRLFKPFIEDELRLISEGRHNYFAHPSADAPCPAALPLPATVVIGPESGFTEYELSRLSELGFKGVTVGTRTLKVETAISVLVGRCIKD